MWRQPELTRRALVRPDERFVTEPRVTVIVTAIRHPQITIQGAIARPGSYVLSGQLTVVELIARAGGLTEFARRDQIAVIP